MWRSRLYSRSLEPSSSPRSRFVFCCRVYPCAGGKEEKVAGWTGAGLAVLPRAAGEGLS